MITESTTPIATSTVLSCNVERVRKAVDRLNVRAKRLRAAPYELTESAPYMKKRPATEGEIPTLRERDEHGITWGFVVEELVDLTLIGTPVKFAGWSFAAKLDFITDGSAGVVISKAPGFETLQIERPDQQRCDHCRKTRSRAVCYAVIHEETGAHKIVGSSCLTDFTGMGRNVERLVELGFFAATLLDEGDVDDEGEGGYGGGRRSRALPLASYLAAVAVMIRAYGWLSRGAAYERSLFGAATADQASGWEDVDVSKRRKFWPKCSEHATRPDMAEALRAIHWAEQLAGDNDYEENIRAIATAGYYLPKHMGLAASIVSSWQRHRERLVRAAMRPRTNPEAHTGTAGKRCDFEVFVSGYYPVDCDIGHRYRVVLVDAHNGAEIIWWCTGALPEEIHNASQSKRADQVTTLKVTATVKKHEWYKNRAQTVVSRLKMTPPPKPKKARKSKKAAGEIVVDAEPKVEVA